MSSKVNQASFSVQKVRDASLRNSLAKLAGHMPADTPANDKAANDNAQGENTSALPLWPEAVRAAPNALLRSALFAVVAKGKRKTFARYESIATVEGVEIQYKGEALDQADLDVWLTILHLARKHPAGHEFKTTSYALLKMMGRADTASNRNRLADRIDRLYECSLKFTYNGGMYKGRLLPEVARDPGNKQWVFSITGRMAALFGRVHYSQVNAAIRRALDGKPLAQWLHCFYSSHAKPYPMNVDTLLRLSGSANETPRSAHQKVRKALEEVATAATASGEAFRFEIVKGLVRVNKARG